VIPAAIVAVFPIKDLLEKFVSFDFMMDINFVQD
jgi:hypothetical protein